MLLLFMVKSHRPPAGCRRRTRRVVVVLVILLELGEQVLLLEQKSIVVLLGDLRLRVVSLRVWAVDQYNVVGLGLGIMSSTPPCPAPASDPQTRQAPGWFEVAARGA